MLLEVMSQLTRSEKNSIRQLLVVWITLLGFRQDLANIVDGSLDAMLVSFFLPLYHDDDADNSVGCCQVE